MKIHNLYKILSFCILINGLNAAEDAPYLTEYKEAKAAGRVHNQVEYLTQLSTKAPEDTQETLEGKKSAILWLVAKSPAKRRATKGERIVIEKALMFAALVQQEYNPGTFITLGFSRNSQIQRHLEEAQKVFSVTRILHKGYLDSEKFTKSIFNNEYMPVVFQGREMDVLTFMASTPGFKAAFTLDRNARAKKILTSTLGLSATNFGFQTENQEGMETFQRLVEWNCVPAIFSNDEIE